jgi:hypothetical protein
MDGFRYRRLTRSRRRREKGWLASMMLRSSLWLGDDHILCLDSTGFSEEFKRFYFKDIQVIGMRTTRRRLDWNIALGILLALVLAEFVFGAEPFSAWSITMGIAGTLLASLLIINNVLGPTCNVYIQTAVQVEALPSLSRVGRLRKFLNRIRPLIATAQGTLTSEEVAQRLQSLRAQETVLQTGAAAMPDQLPTTP